MTTLTTNSTVLVGEPRRHYEVGQRVLWTALHNNPWHYRDGAKIPGTVIAAFKNGTEQHPFLTYRLQLDVVWNEKAKSKPFGKQIVVGNISGNQLLPTIDGEVASEKRSIVVGYSVAALSFCRRALAFAWGKWFQWMV